MKKKSKGKPHKRLRGRYSRKVIYEETAEDDAIRQGDIFYHIPRVDVALTPLMALTDDGLEETEWTKVIESGESVAVVSTVTPVITIVVTQDCDAARATEISLCQIRAFTEVEGAARSIAAKNPAKTWRSIITKQARLNQKWFYLPKDEMMGFDEKKGVDFQSPLRVPRAFLETFKKYRKGRLNELAYAHFRERISEFYRRYPYDEWYPLDKEEFDNYLEENTDAKPFPWQE